MTCFRGAYPDRLCAAFVGTARQQAEFHTSSARDCAQSPGILHPPRQDNCSLDGLAGREPFASKDISTAAAMARRLLSSLCPS
jgi:hypothetical protein